LREGVKPVCHLRRGKRTKVGEFPIDCISLGWEFEVIVDNLSQQAGQEAERKLLERVQVSYDQSSRQGRIGRELFGF
jgi:hypothetical protein